MKENINALTWEELSKFSTNESDLTNGPNTPYASKRLFGHNDEDIKVTLFRDYHAWCPYCQKIWLWLEWKKIPYLVKKASMRCYGQKEEWYLKKVPSGIFPAIEINQKVVTESDRILLLLESIYGPLGMQMEHPEIMGLRRLERRLFQSWCKWLCNPSFNNYQESKREEQFILLAKEVDVYLSKNNSPWLNPIKTGSEESLPGSVDVIFIPYLERMNASLAYYKGLNLRKEFPHINQWFRALEKLDTYRGTQGDFHTHAHDLPPQMGGCWTNKNPKQEKFSKEIDLGHGLGDYETSFQNSQSISPEEIALGRVLKHRVPIMKANPIGPSLLDQPLRAALSTMITGQQYVPNKGTALGLRYLRDRISVPRDMPLLSARKLRQALEATAILDGPEQGPAIPIRNRFDQDPSPFLK